MALLVTSEDIIYAMVDTGRRPTYQRLASKGGMEGSLQIVWQRHRNGGTRPYVLYGGGTSFDIFPSTSRFVFTTWQLQNMVLDPTWPL